MSEVNKESAVQETALPEEALALDPMNPDPETALPDHAPGAILAQIGGDAFEKGKESVGACAAPVGLALATASCGVDDIARLRQRPGEGGWGQFGRIVMENPGTSLTLALIAAVALFGARNVFKAVGSLIKDGARATGRFLIAANERGTENQIVPGSLKDILAGFDENNPATPALSMMQPAGRARIVELDRSLRQFFTNLRFNDQGSGTALYETIVRLAYAHGSLQEIGGGVFVMPGAPAAAAVPAGGHRAPRPGHVPAAAPAPAGRTLDQRRDDLLADYEQLWQALAANNLTVTAAEGFEANLQALMTTIGTTYRLTTAEQENLRHAITTFLSHAPYYRSSVDSSNVLEDRHRRLLTGELKESAITTPRTRAATVLARYLGGAPGPLGAMADQVNHGRADTVDRVATVIDGNVPRRRRVRDTWMRGGASGRGGLVPRGTFRGYVGDVSARSFALGGNIWAALQLAGMAVGAGEPLPARPPVVDPPAIHGLPSPEAAGSESAAEGGQEAASSAAGLKAAHEATERANKKIDLKQVVDMLKSGKNELEDDMSPADKERLEQALRDLEALLKELGVTQEEIDAIKGVQPAPVQSGNDSQAVDVNTTNAAAQPAAGADAGASPTAGADAAGFLNTTKPETGGPIVPQGNPRTTIYEIPE